VYSVCNILKHRVEIFEPSALRRGNSLRAELVGPRGVENEKGSKWDSQWRKPARFDMCVTWFALIVKSQHERAVAEQLAAQSVEAYVPLYRSRRRWSDRMKTVELPLFPRYVFSRFTFEERRKVIGLPSVVSIVGFGGAPSPIREEEIELVKLIAGQDLPISPWPFLRVGERVRVSEGPLCGVEGILVREKTLHRVVVNMELLNRAVAVELERHLLEPVVARPKASSEIASSAAVLGPASRIKPETSRTPVAGVLEQRGSRVQDRAAS
jgi:transcription antitermination factor NusG